MDLEEAASGVETVVPASAGVAQLAATLVHTALCMALLVAVGPACVQPAGVVGFAG